MPTVDPKFLSQIRYRCIGPTRGGRVVAVAADPKHQSVFYFGAVAGGVWKSDDAGQFWENVTDGFLTTGSIGALAVAPSDGNVIYAGTGESTIRIDVTHGDGVYKSTDAGVTWRHMGLPESRHIGEIRVHPDDPDLVYVAAARPCLQGQPRARPLPIEGRWRELGARAACQRTRRCRRRVARSQQPAHHLRLHLADAPHVLVDRQWWPRQRAVAFARRRRQLGEHQPQPRDARRHPRQDRCLGVAGSLGSGVRDGRSRGSQAWPLSLRRHRRDVGEGLVESRPRLASRGTTSTSSPTPPMPTRCSS